MGTKAIRKALARLGSSAGVAEALAELDAIEKSAKVITVDGHGTVGDNPQFRAWADAMALLESIAREAK